MLADPTRWKALPEQVADWLRLQAEKSVLPKRGDLLVETFPRGKRYYMVAYPFEGRLAHQTLGMLLTRRLERAGARPLGFVATDYVARRLGARRSGPRCSRRGKPSLGELFDEDMLGDDLDAWLADSWLLKRTFRNCAMISGLIEKRHPGQEKSGRQVTVSADLIYDVLRTPRARPHPAAGDARRCGERACSMSGDLRDMLSRIRGRIMHKELDRISPLAVPIMLEIGKERVDGEAGDTLLSEAEDADRRGDGNDMTALATAYSRRKPSAAIAHRRRGALCATAAARCSFPALGLLVRLRPASGKGLVLRPARHADPALRHGRDAAQAAGGRSPSTVRRSSSASATAFTMARAPRGCPSLSHRSRSADGRPRLVLDRRQPRSRTRRPDLPGETVARARRRRRWSSATSRRAARLAGEVAGHLHPCARIVQRGRSVRRRCFATDGSAHDHAGLRRLYRLAQRARPRLCRAVPARRA